MKIRSQVGEAKRCTTPARQWPALVVFGCTATVAALLAGAGRPAAADESRRDVLTFANPAGQAATIITSGRLDLDNPFFQDLGANGRRCVTCHQPAAGWSITPANVQARFTASRGDDPIFASNDGSNCEGVTPHSIADRRRAYSLLLTRGLIRVALDVPPGADFAIDAVDDPYHCGPGSNDASLYRRPLPSTNLRFLSAVMWDGRESSSSTTILQDLAHQANDATRGHAQASQDLTPVQVEQIVRFETSLFTAQVRDARAGLLHARRAAGGPVALSRQPFFTGINDPVGLNPTGAAFDARVFTLFDSWRRFADSSGDDREDGDGRVVARLAIARGEALFNTKPITISGVAGLNGETFASGVTVPDTFVGTCTTCHDSPNAGDHSVKAPLDIGVADPVRAPYLPLYTLRNLATQETVRTTDPGRAMITGKWKDIGKFKGPILRGLASRAPYFHNGSAATLEDVVDFYDTRFGLGLTRQEKADLVAFLGAL